MKIGNFSIWLSPSRAGACPVSLDRQNLGNSLVAQLGQAHVVEQLADRRLQLLHRPLEIAAGLLRAPRALQAAHDADRPLEGADHLADRDVAGVTRQHVSALRPVLADDELTLGEALQDLREQLGGNSELLGDPLGADGSEAVVRGDVVDRHQPVVGALRKAEHRLYPSRSSDPLPWAGPASPTLLIGDSFSRILHCPSPASTGNSRNDRESRKAAIPGSRRRRPRRAKPRYEGRPPRDADRDQRL